jgi:hypothetical protein
MGVLIKKQLLKAETKHKKIKKLAFKKSSHKKEIKIKNSF